MSAHLDAPLDHATGLADALDVDDARSLDRALQRLQRQSFDYFVHEANPVNGLVLDKTKPGWPASIAATGMALTVYPVGVERGFVTRDWAVERTLATLRFFASSEQSEAVDASGLHGFYYHFLDMQTGRRAVDCELSSIDTALFIAGTRMAAAWFDGDGADEREIRDLSTKLYERVDWRWMLNGGELVCHGWKPEGGFLPHVWSGYDEALILYVLALGSPTHSIPSSSYTAWTLTYEWKSIYDTELLYAGPLFIHQMSHVWIDFRGIRDAFMRDHDCDYFENSRRATRVQQEYAIRNPLRFNHYGELSWGISASDGPGDCTERIDGIERTFFDYVARGAPYGPDDGTLAPWAVVASLPFAPEIVLPTIAHFGRLRLHTANPYGFKASFNATARCDGHHPAGWVSPYHFGINEGPTVLMIENHRSGLIWNRLRECKFLRRGLTLAGFEGGWLISDPTEVPEGVSIGGLPADLPGRIHGLAGSDGLRSSNQ